MVILGIDPGTSRVGYGIISDKPQLKLLDAGILKITANDNTKRLLETKKQIRILIKRFKPGVMAIEKLYFMRNQKTAMSVAEARGVVLLCAAESKLKIKEFGPNEIKAGITGYGLSDKKAVLKMVRLILKEPGLKAVDDASDALAAAILCSRN